MKENKMAEEQTLFDPSDIRTNESLESTIRAEVVEDQTIDDGAGSYEQESDFESNERRKFWIGRVRQNLTSTYAKRHPAVNALLSLYLLMAFFAFLMTFLSGINVVFSLAGFSIMGTLGGVFISFSMCFYSLYYIYYMYNFVVCNRKDAFIYTHMGSTMVWTVLLTFYLVLTTPDSQYDEDGNKIENSISALVLMAFMYSLLLNAFFMGVLYLIMKIKKYGATAWTLLDVSYKRFRTTFDKMCYRLFFVLLPFIIGIMLYVEYLEQHPSSNNKQSEGTAKVGDYYYEDGTISSKLISGKKVIGVVFSVETSNDGFWSSGTHGQIVALTDVSANKMQWEDGELKDYDNYPNYTWENRLESFDDIDGEKYNEEGGCPNINYECNGYLTEYGEGIGVWYVPTAGQWKRIIENLGKTKVDNMLRFNAEIASRNLEKIKIDPRRWYWTITEFDAENAWSIRISSGEFGSRTNKNNAAYVRPVANF